jgi:hypothetical protein
MRLLLTLALILLVAAAAPADQIFVWFFGTGYGDFINDSPPTFTGAMDPGGDITEGSWTITVPDLLWPDTSMPAARTQYFWDTFFAGNYTPGTPGYWIGYIDVNHGLPEQNSLHIVDDTFGGTMTGVCTIQMLVTDDDNDGVLDDDEFCAGSFSGCIVIIRQGTGIYEGYAGTGSYNGSFTVNCPETLHTWHFGMYIWIDNAVPVEGRSWSAIKALYR